MGKKGSQLSQLKSALSAAGVTGNQQNGKKRKRPSAPQEKDKAKRAAKLEEIHKRLNPFDVKVTKLKHEVGGRKLKGVTGKPAQSRQAGIEARKKTLLVEYETKGRAGGILDRRFGESDPSMSVEERMLERFTRERQRTARSNAFNLEDEDELTHYGQSLSKLDDFDDAGLRMEDEDEDMPGQMSGDVVGKTHFGGFSDDEEGEEEAEPERKKSKAEVMAEVMAKSKEHKLRRQMEREEEDNVRHELDQEFDSLRDLIYAPDPSASGSNSIPLGAAGAAPPPKPAELDYDQRVRELAFDARAKPKDRTKTEEEVAMEEKEALEKAERKRRKRMLGLEESDSEEDEEGGRKRKRRRRGGDDLEDDFDDGEGWAGIGAGLEEGEAQDEEDDEEGSGSDEDGDEGEDEEGDEEDGSDDGEDEEESEVEGEHENLTSTLKPSKGKSKAPDKELPFTFPCPSTHEELLQILDDVDDKDVPTVIQRIRALHHTSLHPDNKVKLQILTSVLIDHILYVSNPPHPRFTLVSEILPHIFTLTRAYPIQAAENFVAKLALMHKNLKRGLAHGALDPSSRTWPGLPELTLLRVIGATWPTSDLNHAVVSPTRVLLGAYLGLARVRSLQDIASGLFLCTLCMQFEALSKRLVPEAVNFAVNSVLHLAPSGYKRVDELPGSFPCPDFGSEACRELALKKGDFKPGEKADLVSLLAGEEATDDGKAQLLGVAVDLLGRFADMYKGLDGFMELFEPLLEVLVRVKGSGQLGNGLKTRLTSVTDAIKRLLRFAREARQPLMLQAHKPIPIPTYIPKFETSKSSYFKNQDPDRERNEAAKLKREYKQERKGAIRELRKDARFLAGVEQKKQAEKDKSYAEGMKKVFGSLQSERAEEKAMEREKTRIKKRAGK